MEQVTIDMTSFWLGLTVGGSAVVVGLSVGLLVAAFAVALNRRKAQLDVSERAHAERVKEMTKLMGGRDS